MLGFGKKYAYELWFVGAGKE